MNRLLTTLLLAGALHAGDRLTFEVVSIKPSASGGRGGAMKVLPGGQEFRVQNFSLRSMISFMYYVPMRQLSGGPDWIDSEAWDIQAKAEHPYELDDLREMFRNMLADEFKLKMAKSVKEGPVYALLVDKSGPKMTVNEKPPDFEISIQGGPGGVTVGRRVWMTRLCYFLQQVLSRDERPVIDKTGLTGFYDFTLSFLPELPPGFDKERLPPEMLNRPSIFEALKSQLGLRLEAQKGPVEYYVVESVSRPEN
jgi:uncharacterized protein (TIGR03435 family)